MFTWLLLLCACNDDDECRRTVVFPVHNREYISMGTVKDSEILTDKGNTLILDESSAERELADGERVFTVCKILERRDKTHYLVKVEKYLQLLDKKYVRTEKEDTLGNSPINVRKAWFGGGYLNLRLELEHNPTSGISHGVNLAYDGTRSNADTLRFRLRHNAYGDTLKTTAGKATASFDIRDLAAEENILVILEWPWYDRHGNPKVFSKEGRYYNPTAQETEEGTDTSEEGNVNIH